MEDRNRLRTALGAAYERFLAAVDGFEPVVLETDPAVGSWSARDVAGHLADWTGETLDAVEHILGGPRPRGQPITHGQSYNAMRAAVRGIDPWPAAAADLAAAVERAQALIDRLEPEQLRAIGPYPRGEIGSVERLLEGLIAHVDEHGAALAAWRLRQLGPPPERQRGRERERAAREAAARRGKAWRTGSRSRGSGTSRGRGSGRSGSANRS